VSIVLEKAGISVKTQPHPITPEVWIGIHEIGMDEFCDVVRHVMTNTDLTEKDPRIDLIAFTATLVQTEGYNGTGTRLAPSGRIG
jgi:hypothetical protein